jgi:putative ABC transport system permease protein
MYLMAVLSTKERPSLLAHDLWMAWRSLRRTPVLSALMIATLAVGITASMIAVTLYHARSGQPIRWKDHKLYAVMLDPRGLGSGKPSGRHPEYPPWQLTYRDAQALYASDIPVRSVMMYQASQVVTPSRDEVKPFGAKVRVTTADFWPREADNAPEAVAVISKFMNAKLFGGENSVGREVVLGGHTYRVIGVIGAWMPRPKYYDPNSSAFDIPEDVYIPFGWMQALKLESSGSVACVRPAKLGGFESLLEAECVWFQFWVEFRQPSDRDRYQLFVDNYTDEWRKRGRFPRANNNRIVDVPTLLTMRDVVGDESRLQVVLGLTFLAVCVLNALGLLLVKFLRAAPSTGLRRALGASRLDIVRQHLVEVTVIGMLGGAVAFIASLCGLAALRIWLFGPMQSDSDDPQISALVRSFVHIDLSMIALGVGLSLLAGVLAGLYPALKFSRVAPATFLKT